MSPRFTDLCSVLSSKPSCRTAVPFGIRLQSFSRRTCRRILRNYTTFFFRITRALVCNALSLLGACRCVLRICVPYFLRSLRAEQQCRSVSGCSHFPVVHAAGFYGFTRRSFSVSRERSFATRFRCLAHVAAFYGFVFRTSFEAFVPNGSAVRYPAAVIFPPYMPPDFTDLHDVLFPYHASARLQRAFVAWRMSLRFTDLCSVLPSKPSCRTATPFFVRQVYEALAFPSRGRWTGEAGTDEVLPHT